MRKILRMLGAVAILGIPLFLMNSVVAMAEHVTPCEYSAKKMWQSCRYEVSEEFKENIANCANISDEVERLACRDLAGETRGENKEECPAQYEARLDVCDLLEEDRYDPDPLTDPNITFIDPDTIGGANIPNPYVSLQAGSTQVLRAGEDFEETVVIHVTSEVREVQGVLCRIVVEAGLVAEDDGEGGVEYEADEVTDDYFAQSDINYVYYCGEISREFEDGFLSELEGSFLSGVEFAKAGILIKANPEPGDAHRQEFLLGDAEDTVQYIGLNEAPSMAEGGENPNDAFNCSLNGGCVKTEEFNPNEPEAGEFKYYLQDVGFVLAVAMVDDVITGEREELVCTGDSLAILADPSCEIEDVGRLLEELCRLSPDAFCEAP